MISGGIGALIPPIMTSSDPPTPADPVALFLGRISRLIHENRSKIPKALSKNFSSPEQEFQESQNLKPRQALASTRKNLASPDQASAAI